MLSHFHHVAHLLGGISLFLYGALQSTEAFRSAFGTRTLEVMSRFTQKKFYALVFGAGLAAVAQGSTVSASLAVSFSNVGMLSLPGSIAVMMGASIGGAFVTFLISLDIVSFSPLLLAVSSVMTRLGNDGIRKAGSVLQALSLTLMGMLLLKMGAGPLLHNPQAGNFVAEIAGNPFMMFFSALLGTVFLQSSASVMALAVTFAATLPRSAVFPAVLGSHLGSSVTILLVAAGGRSAEKNARVLGVAVLLYKLVGVLVFAPFVPYFSAFLDWLNFPMPVNVVMAQVLLAFLNAAIFYPWPQVLAHASLFILAHANSAHLGAPAYLDEKLLEIPSLAVRLLAKEMIRVINYLEAYLQMQLRPDQGESELKKLLPNGIQELTEACEQYMYAIKPPSIAEDRATGQEYRAIFYTLSSLRETSRLATGRFRGLIGQYGLDSLRKEMGRQEWENMTKFLLEASRDAFHAFSLGDANLARRSLYKEE